MMLGVTLLLISGCAKPPPEVAEVKLPEPPKFTQAQVLDSNKLVLKKPVRPRPLYTGQYQGQEVVIYTVPEHGKIVALARYARALEEQKALLLSRDQVRVNAYNILIQYIQHQYNLSISYARLWKMAEQALASEHSRNQLDKWVDRLTIVTLVVALAAIGF